ncbi:MAG: ubiquinone/menaquinone biosynthesis C-methylase UbiE [Desulforhopalus sp.]|jgi:ubiquinone/menaquinone biosynthesis C-methylase UbiE
MTANRFDSKKLQKLNNPERLLDIPVDFMWDLLESVGAEVMVDIGAGTAFFSIAVLKHTGCSTMYACDVSETMITWIGENVVPEHPAIIPVKTEGVIVPLEDGIADVVFMINLHHELDDPLSVMDEVFRILRPGGKVLVVDWKKKDMDEGPPADIRYLPHVVEEQLTRNGFNTVFSTDELEKHFIVIGTKD